MRIGVVIPTYNIERYLSSTLDSLIAQSYEQWKCVVVDDGSSDGTRGIVETYANGEPRISFIFQRNQGGAAAREAGFDAVENGADAVLFFDHDDLMRPSALKLLVDGLARNPDSPACYGLAAFVNEDAKPFKRGRYEGHSRSRVCPIPAPRKLRLDEPTDFATLLVKNVVPIGGILIRIEAKKQAGKFDPNYGYAHDWEMWLRLSLLGPLAFVNEVVYDYRVLTGSMSSQSDRFEVAERKVLRKFMFNPEIPENLRVIARHSVRYATDRMLAQKARKGLRRMLRFQVRSGLSVIAKSKSDAALLFEQ